MKNIQRQKENDINAVLVVDTNDKDSERIRAHLLNMRVISYPYVQLFKHDNAVVAGGLFD